MGLKKKKKKLFPHWVKIMVQQTHYSVSLTKVGFL